MSMIWCVAEVNSGLGGKMKKRLQVLYIDEQFGHLQIGRKSLSLLSTKPGLFMLSDPSIPSRQATHLLV